MSVRDTVMTAVGLLFTAAISWGSLNIVEARDRLTRLESSTASAASLAAASERLTRLEEKIDGTRKAVEDLRAELARPKGR